MNRPRILHLRASNFVGGPEQQLLRHIESGENGPWEILLGVFQGRREGEDLIATARRHGLATVPVPAQSSGAALRALTRLLRDERIALLCTHGYKADILGLLAGRSTGVPVACFLRGWTREDWKVRLYEAGDRLALRFADRIVCLSETQVRNMSSRPGLAGKIRVVCNAIDAPAIDSAKASFARRELRRRFNLPAQSLVAATAGRLSPEKGVEDFLKAAARVRSRLPNARFVIFGDGALRRALEQKAAELKLTEQVTFAGFHRDLRALLPGLDLLVNPSLSEEMPNIVLEAMAASIPVVATSVGGVEEMAGAEKALSLVRAGQSQELAEAICDLLSNPERARALSQAGRRRVEQAFSVEKQTQQIRSLYRELCPSADREESVVTPPKLAGPASPFLSVVIPVRNEEAHLGAVLNELEAQDYPRDRFEVLVADGNSTDGTTDVVEAFAKRSPVSTRLFSNPAQRSSAGRNVGARNARGEYVIFIDGHCHLSSRTLLRDIADLFARTGADCLCRPQPLKMSGNTLFQDVVAHVRATPLGHGRGSMIYATDFEGRVNPFSSGAIYRRTVFDRIGYYDERFDASEDVEFNHRVHQAGMVSYSSPKLAAMYRPREDMGSLWKQMIRYGRGRVRLVRKHRDAFSLGQIVPAGLLAWLALGGVVSLFSGRVAAVYLAALAFYLCVVVAFSATLAARYGLRHLFLAPPVYLAIHLGLGAGSLSEFLFPQQRYGPGSDVAMVGVENELPSEWRR